MNRNNFLQILFKYFNLNKKNTTHNAGFEFNFTESLKLDEFFNHKPSAPMINDFFIGHEKFNNLFKEIENKEFLKIDDPFFFKVNRLKKDDNNYYYHVSFNPNLLYDILVLKENNLKDSEGNYLIYRVEYFDKKNGYTGYYHSHINNNENHSDNALSPIDDINFSLIFSPLDFGIPNHYSKNWFFGFANLDLLKQWFGNDYSSIEKLIRVYSVPSDFVILGQHQLIFQKKYSNIL